MMRRPTVYALIGGIAVGSALTLALTYGPDTPPALYCIVSNESAASRGLEVGTPVDAGGSGCVPSEQRYCISATGAVLLLERC